LVEALNIKSLLKFQNLIH